MSLVGPRPEVQKYIDLFSDEEQAILQVRPGITDWASIWNSDEGAVLAGSQDPDRAFEELIRPTKVRLQLKYVRERSFCVDLKILAFTVFKLFKKGWLPAESSFRPVATGGRNVPDQGCRPAKRAFAFLPT